MIIVECVKSVLQVHTDVLAVLDLNHKSMNCFLSHLYVKRFAWNVRYKSLFEINATGFDISLSSAVTFVHF